MFCSFAQMQIRFSLWGGKKARRIALLFFYCLPCIVYRLFSQNPDFRNWRADKACVNVGRLGLQPAYG
jgi:hypothetical protein